MLQDFVKSYCEGQMDISQVPHMINYVWQDKDTKISFSYASKRPDMTVITFESVGEAAGQIKTKN